MKKILAFTLCLIILISCMPFSATAYEYPKPPYNWKIIEIEEITERVRTSFKELILKNLFLPDNFNENHMETEVYCTQDEVTIFFGCYGDMNYSGTQQLIGQYAFFGRDVVSYNNSDNNPIGLYALKNDNTVISLFEAYNEGIVDIDAFAACYPKHTKLSDREFDIINKLDLNKQNYHYEELFLMCTGEAGATPDYVLVDASNIIWHNDIYIEKIGDYVIAGRMRAPKDHLSYYVYLANGELLTICEAAERGIPVIEDAILSSEIPCALAGDCDGDSTVTVKDATHIQKKVADLYLRGVYDHRFEAAVEDFDNDGNLTVRDATAIQKKVAGLKQ